MVLPRSHALKRLFALVAVTFLVTTPLLTMAMPVYEPDTRFEIDLNGPHPETVRDYVTEDDWPMLLYDAGHQGASGGSPLPEDNGTIWELDLGTGIDSSPVVVNNTVYVVTTSGIVNAINASTGEPVWTSDLGAECHSTPAAWGDFLLMATAGGEMAALDIVTGDGNWTADLGAAANSSPIVDDGKAYIGSENGKVWAFNITDGVELWNNTTAHSVMHSPALGDGVLLVSSGNSLQAFNATNGFLLWTNTTAGAEISGPMASGLSSEPFGWMTYVLSDDGKVHAFNISDGEERWSNTTSFRGPYTPTKSGSLVLVAGELEVMAFNYSNSEWMWNYTIGENMTTSAILGWSSGWQLMVGASTGIYTADLDISAATENWTFDAGSRINTPALAYGRAFVTTTDGRLILFGHVPTATIDTIGPDPVPQGDVLTLTGHGSDAQAFTNYRWVSDIDGIIAEGPSKATAPVTSLSLGTHDIHFMVQDDNWTWSRPHVGSVEVIPPTDWPMFGQNSHRTSHSDTNLPATNGTKWMVDLTGDDQDVMSSPIIIGDMAFVGTRDFWVHALNLSTGEEVWSYKTGGSVDSTIAYSNGYIYVGSGDTRVYCLDADPSDGIDEGQVDFLGATYDLIWTFDTNGPVWASPIVVNDVVYVTTTPAIDHIDPNPGRLYAIHAPVGGVSTELWHFTIPNNVPSYSSPLVFGDLVLFGANDNRIYAVERSTGEEVWNLTTGDSIQSSPAGSDGMVYIGSNDNSLYAIHASNGSLAWSRPTGDSIRSSPAVHDGVVYVGSMDNDLYAFDAVNGIQLWTFEQATDGIWSSPAVVSGHVLFGSYDGYLYVVNTTSHDLLWKRHIGPIAQSSPSVAQDTVLIGASRGYMYAFGKAPDLSLEQGDVTFSLSTPQVGVQVTIEAMVRNLGTITGNGSVNFYDGADLIGGSFVEITAGGSENVSVKWSPMSHGFHILTINITNIQPHDSNPANNQVLKSIDVLEQTEGWRMFQKDIRHTGLSDVATPNNNQVLWSFDVGGDVRSSPVVADQLMFIGSSNGIHSLVENPGVPGGSLFWENTSIPDIDSTPAIVNAIVYATSTNGRLYAIDAWNGEPLWDIDVSASASSPIVVNNTVLIGTSDGGLVAVNSMNGSLLWQRPMNGEVVASPAVHEDVVIVANANGQDSKVEALAIENGSVLWSFPVGYDVLSSPTISISGPDSYVHVADTNGTVYKLETVPDFKDDGISNNGNYDLIWAYETGLPIRSSAAISGNNIYMTIGNDTIISLTSNGELNWRRTFSVDEGRPLVSSPAVALNKIFVGGDRIYCLDASTGLEVWAYGTGSTVTSSPAITLGKVFFATEAGHIYAFGNITPRNPTAVISSPVDDGEYRVGEEIVFNASASTDDGVILEYVWDFGDGIGDTGPILTHSYSNIGEYTISLTVKDNEVPPLTDTLSITFHLIPNVEPVLTNGSVTPTEGNITTRFNFTVTYSDPDDDPPLYVKVSVSGEEYVMEKVHGPSDYYVQGVMYYCITDLPSGNHSYSFKASDGVLDVSIISGEGLKVWQVAEFVKDEITARMEFVGQGRIVIEPPTFPFVPPAGYIQKDIVLLSTEDICEWTWMHLEINGTGRNITEGVIPDTLRIFWHNGTSWVELDSTMELGSEKIYTNVTFNQTPTLGQFGLFGRPMAENRHPVINSIDVVPGKTSEVDKKITLTINATDADGDILYYQINWGDGSEVTEWDMANVASHKFRRADTFTIRVFVTDDLTNASHVTQDDVTVTIRETGSSEALVVLAIIIVVVLAVAFVIPIKSAVEDKDKDKDKDEDEDDFDEIEEEEEEGAEDEDEDESIDDEE